MPSKRTSRGAVSKISSAAAPSAAGTTLSAKKSSVIRSAFSPSEYQLALFASVIQGLDAHHLRIHNVNSGRLQCEHSVSPKELITSLDWGYYGDRDQHLKKKRKRSSAVNASSPADQNNAVVAFGTSSSEIRMYCPAEDKILGTLTGGHEGGVRDFKFTVEKPGLEGWSIGGDGKLVQWDLRNGHSIRVISLPSTSVSALARPVSSNPPVLCASQTPYLIDLKKEGDEAGSSFSAMRNSIHSLISSTAGSNNTLSGPFLAADSDRYINVFDSENKKLLGSLVSDKEIDFVSFYTGSHNASGKVDEEADQKQVLAAVTREGAIRFFTNPFRQFSELSANAGNSTSLKSLRKSMTRRPDATLRIVRADKSRSPVPVVSVSFHGPDIVVAWVEGGIDLVFDKIRWQDEETDELVFHGDNELARGKSSSTIGSAMMNGVKDIGKTHVDETNAIVQEGGASDDLATNDADHDAASASSGDEGEELEDPTPAKKPQDEDDDDIEMADVEEGEAGEPSFGELVRANAAQIDVEAELDDREEKGALVPRNTATASLQLPPGLSLATVLSQSLKTNDNTLLESCFHTTDMDIVKATIQRMDSSLATTLLQKLAERLSTRPGRYGHLLVWVQWTCISHGGSIAGKPDILKQMTSLFKVMDQRSSSLPSLLLLKGKLDMLDAQLMLRQSLHARDGHAHDDEERVIYVEGQEDEAADSDEDGVSGAVAAGRGMGGEKMLVERDGDEEMAIMVNGMESGSDDEDDGDDNMLIFDEAEVSGDDEEDSDDDDGEGGEGEEEGEDDSENGEDGSMVDFIADSDEESDAASVVDTPRSSKKGKLKRGRAI